MEVAAKWKLAVNDEANGFRVIFSGVDAVEGPE